MRSSWTGKFNIHLIPDKSCRTNIIEAQVFPPVVCCCFGAAEKAPLSCSGRSRGSRYRGPKAKEGVGVDYCWRGFHGWGSGVSALWNATGVLGR